MGSKKWEVGGQKSNQAALSLNDQKSEIRSSNFVKFEVWSLKTEVGSRKTLLGFRSKTRDYELQFPKLG